MGRVNRLKVAPVETDVPFEGAQPVARTHRIVSAEAGIHSQAVSPARDLLKQLEVDLNAAAIPEEKWPLRWTMLGLGLFCSLSWYGLLQLVF